MSGEMNEASQLLEQLVQEFRLDVALADVEQARAEVCHLKAERDAAMAERDTALAAVDRLATQRNAALADARAQLAANRVIIEERDVAEKERTESRAEVVRLHAERDAARDDVATLIGERNQSRMETINWQQRAETLERAAQRLTVENEGLRADALAYPPQRIEFTQYADLKADYDLQVIVIETLQEGLKRTETLLAKAQAEHIDDRLKGFLSVISQLADQAQDLLP